MAACGGADSDSDADLTAITPQSETPAERALAAETAPTWTLCAAESQVCSFNGTRVVRYGRGTQLATTTATGSVLCSNGVFGDPAPYLQKSCWYSSQSRTPALSGDWIDCAGEGQKCSFSGTRQTRYGTVTQFVTGSFSGSVSCTNAVFGDPAYGQAKRCAYAADKPVAMPEPVPANAPIVLNAPLSARAGDVIGLQGENFGSAAQVWLDGANPRELAVVNRVGTAWVAAQIPADATGALIIRVLSNGVSGAPVKLNAALPYHLDALSLSPGGAFRVFGRNLLVANATPSVTVNGLAASLNLAASDEHMLVAAAPTGLAAGSNASIAVDNGNGSGAATLDRSISIVTAGSGDPFALGVGWASAFSTFSAKAIAADSDSRLVARMRCDGVQDNSTALQSAVDLAAASGGGVVRVPAGTCRLRRTINLKSKVVIDGAGKSATLLQYDANYPFSGIGIDLSGLRNLSLSNTGASQEGLLLKNSTRVFLQNVTINLGTSRQMFLSGNRNVVISGCDFNQAGSINQNGPYVTNGSSGLVFSGNVTRWVNGASSFGGTHDAYMSGNRFIRDAAYQNTAGTVHSFTMDFAYRIAVVGNSFEVINGPITNKTRNDGETLLSEGGGAARTENLGTVASASATTLSDPLNTINVDPFRTGAIPEDYGVAIVAGKGAGQSRRVLGYAGGTLTVDRAWAVVPDSSSRYATFVWGLEKSLIKGNSLSQNPRGIWLYHTAIREVDVIGNRISNGGGIYLRSYQNLAQKMFMPIWGVRIAGNSVSNSTGNWMSYIDATFVNSDARAFGIANLGLEIRDNLITGNTPNVSSRNEEYANVEGYINMMRVENYDIYEPMAMPRMLGTLFQRNACTHCDTAFRLGTGAGGTVIMSSRLSDVKTVLDDWATTKDGSKSSDTVVK